MLGPYLFQQNVVLIPLQEEERQKELECKREEKGARERLEVCCNPHPHQLNPILTPSQREGRQRELEHKWKEARELKERHEVCYD